MDIDEILQIIPKPIHQWNQKEVEVWLTFIQLPQLIPKFKYYRIEGQNLLKLNKDILSSTFCIESNIIKKKIINWIQFLVYSQQYCHQQLKKSEIHKTPQTSKRERRFDYQLTNTDTFQDQSNSQTAESNESTMTKQLISQKPKTTQYSYIQDHETLHIYEKCQNANRFLVCDQTSITFGRNPQNNYFIIETNIEPYHCTIIHRENHHYIIASIHNSGVWIKITKRLALGKKCIIEMGETDFQVFCDGPILTIVTFGARCEGEKHEFDGRQKQSIRIGRRHNCDIILPFDTTLSGFHGKFTYHQNWYFEDLETTNGSWVRVMKEEMVTDKMIFRMGKSNYVYESRIWKNDDCRSVSSASSQLGTCRKCRNNEKNCYFKPCYHNQFCFECGSAMNVCSICHVKISKIEKIYKL